MIPRFQVYGYSFVPPTPFQLKDWERYDVSRFVDPGCVSPEEGMRTIPVSDQEQRFTTIQKDLTRSFLYLTYDTASDQMQSNAGSDEAGEKDHDNKADNNFFLQGDLHLSCPLLI